ncbi:ATP-dependent acyl-CoA ligase [Actinomadura vinacea]|uniref:ATP-dependent acyl-CoA ligase n=1 Tax=Actinomadura vinacea TaxID=115336 RepID=A0ABN3IRF4_9ACTN
MGEWRSVGELITWAAAAYGPADALRFEGETISFSELDQHTARLAQVFQGMGIDPGDRIAIMLPNGIAWPAIWLSAIRAGAVVVPINKQYRSADLEFVLHDSGASLVVTDDVLVELVAEVAQRCSTVPAIRTVGELDALAAELSGQGDGAQGDVEPGALANLQYTSGSTGFPKACMLTHDYWLRAADQMRELAELSSSDVVITAQPFSYMDPQWNVVMCLMAGTPLVVLPRFSASGFWASAREARASVVYLLGTMPMLLFKQPPSELDLANDMRVVLCSGILPNMHHAFESRWGAPWREVYGLTETGGDLGVPLGAADRTGTGTVGKPLGRKDVRIVDRDGEYVPHGTTGEIVVSGPPSMTGYWNQPDLTAEVFRDGWFHTGDLGHRDDDGWFYLTGRLKDMVRRGGENVSCAEVEAVVVEHPDVQSCAVVGVSDELFGEEVKVFVQPRPGSAPTPVQILEFARERLARFKVPRYVQFVDSFPMTPSERVAKHELRRRFPDDGDHGFDALVEAKRTAGRRVTS